MHKQIYVNLPVKDLAKSKAFFAALGYGFNAQFTDDKAACMELGENLYAMLLVEPFFAGFTAKPVADAKQVTEVLVCLSCDSREQLETLVAKARAAGGAVTRAMVDHGFMVQHAFEDLDGHIWELVHMVDPAGAAVG